MKAKRATETAGKITAYRVTGKVDAGPGCDMTERTYTTRATNEIPSDHKISLP